MFIFSKFGVFYEGGILMNIDIENLLKEAKVLYWKENETFQQNHIGIQDINKSKDNDFETLVLQCNKE
jgi:hypothetical protein